MMTPDQALRLRQQQLETQLAEREAQIIELREACERACRKVRLYDFPSDYTEGIISKTSASYAGKCVVDSTELAQLRMDREWQPLGTAPNDGINVLLRIELSNGQSSVMINRLENMEWKVHFHGCFRPTHWMPMPSAARSATQEGK